LFSYISIFGLSLAIGCLIIPFIFINFWNSVDAFHENIDNIFYIEILINRSGTEQIWGPTPVPLGPSLKSEYSQIKEFVRIRPRSGAFRYQDKVFEEPFLFVDEGFLDMFTFPVIMGNPNALENRNSVIISDRYAKKYFSDENPLGKRLTLSNRNQFREQFIVEGVVEKNPGNSSIQFDILIPYKVIQQWEGRDLNNWADWTHTFIQVEDPRDIDVIRKGMDKYIEFQKRANKTWSVGAFIFEPFSKLSKNTEYVTNDIGIGTASEEKFTLAIIGIFLMLLACFNYVNIGIVTATRRLNEIGIRKVLGSTRTRLMLQFLSENFLLCLIAVIVGVIFAEVLLLPAFNGMFDIPLKMDFQHNFGLWIFLAATLLFTSIGSGSYPAFYVSRFRPVDILRRTQQIGGGSKFTKVLLAFQFMLTFILLGSAFIFLENSQYQKGLDWGYNQEQIVNIELEGKKHFEVYRNAIAQNPSILSLAGSQDHLGRSSDIDVVAYKGKEYEIRRYVVGYNYLNTMQFRLREGRLFDQTMAGDIDRSIIVNEKLARSLGLQKPVGTHVKIEDREYLIIGLVEDFHDQPFGDPIEPILFRLCETDEFDYISVRLKAGQINNTMDFLKGTWVSLFHDQPFEGIFQEDIWVSYFRFQDNIAKMQSFVGMIALVISCMGLFGLISISIVKRMKEISIRKVHGASVADIARLLNKDLIRLLIISIIIATPVCYYLMNQLLNLIYRYRVPITLVPFVVICITMVFSSLLTIGFQVYRAAKSNPVDMLRVE